MRGTLFVAALFASASFAQTKFVPGPLPPHVRSSPKSTSGSSATSSPDSQTSPNSSGSRSAPTPSSSLAPAQAPSSSALGAPTSPGASADAPPPPDVPAYEGSLAQGLREMQRLSDAEKNDDALKIGDELLAPNSFLRWKMRASATDGWKKTLVELADPLLDALGANGAEPAERAAVHYAKGVVQSRAEKRAESEREFEAARTLAGPGDLRLDAMYNLGTADLFEGETQRAQIPEVNGGKNAPPSASSNAAAPPSPTAPAGPSSTAPAAAGQAQPADALALAKQAYLRARDHFVERLRVDWRDADARANTELVMRRLKELDEIQKKRDEQKKQQEKQNDSKQNDKSDKKDDKDKKDDSKKDEKQDKPDKDSKDKQNQDKKPEDNKDDKSQDQKKPDEKKPDDKKDQPDEKKPDESKDEKDAQGEPQKEQQLTKEEVMRLFDRLKDIEDKARELQMQLRHARRAKVKKDW